MNIQKQKPKLKYLKGEIVVPGDKSISHRAIIFGSLAHGITKITGLLESQDCLNTIKAFQQMNVNISKDIITNDYLITGVGIKGLQACKNVIYCGNSGTTMRLLVGLLSGQNFNSELNGDESLNKRPMKRVIEPLMKMGAKISSQNTQYSPLSITGADLKGIIYKMPIASAQVKSAILLAGLNIEDEVRVIEPSISRNHTEIMMKKFGVELIFEDNTIILPKGLKKLNAQDINIPGDISSSAFFIVGALITPNSEITIKNVGINHTRSGIIDVITAMGGEITFDNIKDEGEKSADIFVKYQKLQGTVIEGDIIPRLIDEIPIIALLASQADGKTIIRNAEELKVKESNRIKTITTELSKLGINIQETEDGMIIEGPCEIKGDIDVLSYGDHRIAMTLLIANLIAKHEIHVNDLECINTSFPNFIELLQSLIHPIINLKGEDKYENT